MVRAFLPFLLISIGNIMIMKRMRQLKRNSDNELRLHSSGDKKINSLTMMLLSISALFLILIFPTYVLKLHWLYNGAPNSIHGIVNFFFAYDVCILILYLNHAINFVLYCITGTKFRLALLNTLCCCRPVKNFSKLTNTSTLKNQDDKQPSTQV